MSSQLGNTSESLLKETNKHRLQRIVLQMEWVVMLIYLECKNLSDGSQVVQSLSIEKIIYYGRYAAIAIYNRLQDIWD